MTMKKTLLALLLILCLCLPTFVACEMAESETEETTEDTEQKNGTEGLEYTELSDGTYEVSVGKVKRAVRNIVIPAEHDGKAVTQIADEGFKNFTTLESISIPDSITSIGDSAFHDCMSLKTLNLPDSVKTIENNAFFGCSGLKKIVFGENSGLEYIGDDAFSGCWGLTSINIPKSVLMLGDRAFVCSKVESITVEEGNIAYYSEDNCLLAKLDNRVILGCKNSVIPTDGRVTEIADWAFMGCISLESIIIPDSVTTIGTSAFEDCVALTAITIPDGVTSIGEGAFCYCDSLTSVVIPDSVIPFKTVAKKNCLQGLTKKRKIITKISTLWQRLRKASVKEIGRKKNL